MVVLLRCYKPFFLPPYLSPLSISKTPFQFQSQSQSQFSTNIRNHAISKRVRCFSSISPSQTPINANNTNNNLINEPLVGEIKKDLFLFNTMSRQKEKFKPKVEGKVGMYVCGVTAYDFSHIGHARAYVTFDVLYRYLKYLGYDVYYVRNFTDVDDKDT